jgi:aldehyde:ferredoxin oxidoreductase
MPELGYNEPHDRHRVDGKAEFVIKFQNLMGVVDSLKVCKFGISTGMKIKSLTEWLNYVVGWEDYTTEELLKAGERIYNVKRLFNVGCGVSRKDDTLPLRHQTLKREGEGVTVNLPPLGRMLSEYYDLRGWDEIGIPKPEKVKELNI